MIMAHRIRVDGQDALALRALDGEALDRHVRRLDRDAVVGRLAEDGAGGRAGSPVALMVADSPISVSGLMTTSSV